MADISQEIEFNTSPQDIYGLLTSEKKFAEITDASAKIDARVGGNFSVWNDYATGKFNKLIAGKEIIQSWRASDWPDGAESKVTITLTAKGDGCMLHFTQTGVPEEFAKDIEQGWQDYYWSLMQKYLEQKNV